MGREHGFELRERFAFNDATVGPNKFRPNFKSIEPLAAKMAHISPSQLERRTLYFEGGPADLVHT